MWSTNSARTRGKQLANSLPDPHISDAELGHLIRREMGHEFRPRKSVAEGNAETASGLAAFGIFVAIVAFAFAAFVMRPDWFPRLMPEARENAADYISAQGLGPWIWLLVALVGVLAIGLCVWSAVAAKRARESRRRLVNQLFNAAIDGARQTLDRRVQQLERGERQREARRSRYALADPAPLPPPPARSGTSVAPPPPAGRRLSPSEAEELAAQWMRFLGEPSAVKTRDARDRGIDVQSTFFLAQVKHYNTKVAVGPVRELAGVLAGDARGRRGLFFTQSGYTPEAVRAAENTNIALFVYDEIAGTLTPVNRMAEYWWHNGLNAPAPR